MNRGFGNVVHGGDGRSGWWDRRQAHEAAIHRRDVQAAVAKADPIESNLALDGVGEFFEVALGRVVRNPDHGLHGGLGLVTIDQPARWTIEFTDIRAVVLPDESAPVDAIVRGRVSDLVLWLWKRPAVNIEIEGDPALPSRWREGARF